MSGFPHPRRAGKSFEAAMSLAKDLQAQLDALRPVPVDEVPEAWKDGRVVEGWVDEWWLPLRLIIDPGSQSQQWVCAEHWRELKDGTWGPYPADDVTFYYPTWLRLPLPPQEPDNA